MSGLVAALWLVMQIQGGGSCPAAGEVEGKLAPPDAGQMPGAAT